MRERIFPVRMRFLFEPAEEIGEGAKRMLAAGALDGEPDIFSHVSLRSGSVFWNGSA